MFISDYCEEKFYYRSIGVACREKFIENQDLKNYKIDNFYFYTPNSNLTSIQKWGILSKNIVEWEDLNRGDISNLSVQQNRDKYISEFEFQKLNGHNYVPLFISKKVPMMHYLYKENKSVIENCSVILIKPEILMRPGVFFTNMNLAVNESEWYSNNDLSQLSNLEWSMINRASWFDENPAIRRINGQLVSAEILVSHFISPDWFDGKPLNYETGLGIGLFNQ